MAAMPRNTTERLEYELGIIAQMGFPDYFLALYDCTKAAREMGIPVGTARGSCRRLERGLRHRYHQPRSHGIRADFSSDSSNPERVSMPDIDIDYADHRDRSRMIDLCKAQGTVRSWSARSSPSAP
jgi:DNA polymerase-3 subunit alpha